MEDKIQKLFLCLEDIKNEKLFDLCISQISEIYRENPSLGLKILEKNSKLLNSKNWNQRVMGASILERTYSYHCENLRRFLKEIIQENLEDILNDFSHLFYLEKVNTGNNDRQKHILSDRPHEERLFSLEGIKLAEDLDPERIDFEELISKEKPLYGYDDKVYKDLEKNGSNFDEEQFFANLSHEKNFDLRNFTNLLNLSKQENIEKETAEIVEEIIPETKKNNKRTKKQENVEETKEEEKEKEEPIQGKRGRKPRGKAKETEPQLETSKKKLKTSQNNTDSHISLDLIENQSVSLIKASIPFNSIFKTALRNLFHTNWEKRHSSCLILKAFLKENYAFLGFVKEISIEKNKEVNKLEIVANIKADLEHFELKDLGREKKTMDILTRVLVIVALDRFGDFLFEKYYLVVRETACQTFGAIITVPENFSIEKMKMFAVKIKALLEKPDWQIVQSALYLLKTIILSRPEFKRQVFDDFNTIFLVLIEGTEETQQLVTEILTLYSSDSWLFSSYLPFLRSFLSLCWQALVKLDEISYATCGILELLLIYHHDVSSMRVLYPEGFDHGFHLSRLIRFYHHTMVGVRRAAYRVVNAFIMRFAEEFELENIETIRKITLLTMQNLLVEEEKEIIDLLSETLLSLIGFLSKTDKPFLPDLLRSLFRHTLLINTASMVSGFRCFETFNETNPYKTLGLSTKPQDMLDAHYKRLIIVAGLIGRMATVKEEIMTVLKEFGWNLKANASDGLMMLAVYSEIVSIDPGQLERLKDCRVEALEAVISVESQELQRSDIKDLESSIFANLNTLKVLISQAPQEAQTQFLSFLSEALKMKSPDRRRKMEEIYNKLVEMGTSQTILTMDTLEKTNIENCSKQIIFSINNFVSTTKELQSYLRVSAVFLYLQHFVQLKRPPEKLNLLIRPLLSSLTHDRFSFFVELASRSLYNLTMLFEDRNPSPIPKVLKNVVNSLLETKKTDKSKEKLSFLYSTKAEGVNGFLKMLIEKHGRETFLRYPCVMQTAMTDIDAFYSVFDGDNEEKVFGMINLLGIKGNLKMIGGIITNSLMNQHTLDTVEIIAGKIYKLVKFFDLREKREKHEVIMRKVEGKNPGKTNETENEQLPAKIHYQLIQILRKLALKISQTITQGRTNDTNPKEFEALFITLIENICIFLRENNALAYELLSGLYREYEENFVELAPVFIIRVLKSLNNKERDIREFSFKCLGEMINSSLVQDFSSVPQLNLSSKLSKARKKGLSFILDFKNNRNFSYEPQGKIDALLRPYQLEGVKWLAFLAKYNLHGALCDDMGLGKTLQMLVVIQSELCRFYEKNPGKKSISLIICPPTLMEHWLHEINKYLDSSVVRPMIYRLNSVKNEKEIVEKCNVLICSYNNLQKSIDLLNGISYFFCVVDEGHILKNAKTKISKSIKTVKAEHRFVLTGTPIQGYKKGKNNILELWSIFDFLMPEFLGDEDFFKKNFAKMLQINVMKFSDHSLLFSKEQDKILKDLHHKITPFILRREKIEVLKELPQKIIQDFYCSMTELQCTLYSELERNQIAACNEELGLIHDDPQPNIEQSKSVFELMILLRKLCNHPYQLMNDKTFRNSNAFARPGIKANDYESSGKFLALKDLLCELGYEENSDDPSQNEDHLLFLTSTNKNKILIFSRFKETLDLITQSLLDKVFPKIRYLRLDGSVPVDKRFALTKLFNEDSEYKIMLLTTAVGGVGLNLSSANVVIMFDHDYNPMNDLQAIDRAHRIGQKNILNVYRLIMKDTLEEKIMGIQKFKSNVANAVINAENASIKNIKDSNILSLFGNVQEMKKEKAMKNEDKPKSDMFNPYARILENLQELWSEAEYNPQK